MMTMAKKKNVDLTKMYMTTTQASYCNNNNKKMYQKSECYTKINQHPYVFFFFFLV